MTSTTPWSRTPLERLDQGHRVLSIPPGMVIALLRGMGPSYIGVGGGIVTSDLVSAAAISQMYWRHLVQ